MKQDNTVSESRPWYKEYLLWLVIILPVSAVVAGISTVIIAYQNKDDLVVDDYYKQGLAINRNLDEINQAQKLKLDAKLVFLGNTIKASVKSQQIIKGDLQLDVIHPTQKIKDHHFTLINSGNNEFRAHNPFVISGSRYLRLSSIQGQWILKIRHNVTPDHPIELSAFNQQ